MNNYYQMSEKETLKNLKTTKTNNPLFRENYVGSDFSIAHWRYVGIRSTTLSNLKAIKSILFSSPQSNVQSEKTSIHINIAKRFPWSTTDVEGANTFPLHNQPPNPVTLRDLSLFFPSPFWIK